MKSKWILAVLAATLALAAYVGNVLATPNVGQSTTILARATVDDLDLTAHYMTMSRDDDRHPYRLWMTLIKTHGLSDIYVVDNTFAPNGGTSGWHTHPGPSLIFVKAGTVTNYISDEPGCPPHIYTAGQSFIDPGGDDQHMIRNEDPNLTAETIAVQFLPQGADRKIDEPARPGCAP